jgi:hypothetical protein
VHTREPIPHPPRRNHEHRHSSTWRTHARYGAVRDLDFDLVYALWLGPAQEYSRHWLGGEIRTAPIDVARELADAAWQALGTTNN